MADLKDYRLVFVAPARGKTAVHVSVDGHAVGFIGIADTIRPSARQAVTLLRALGTDVVLLSNMTYRLREHDVPVLHAPAQEHLRDRAAHAPSHVDQRRMIEALPVRERAVRLDDDSVVAT